MHLNVDLDSYPTTFEKGFKIVFIFYYNFNIFLFFNENKEMECIGRLLLRQKSMEKTNVKCVI